MHAASFNAGRMAEIVVFMVIYRTSFPEGRRPVDRD
jgi:hypothetical protein